MGWWGAIIGAALGWVVGGPWGAVVGAAIGLLLASRSVRVHVVGGNPAHAQQVFFRATFQVMGHVAKADGRVSENEIRAARAVMAQMNLSPEQQRAAMEFFSQGKQPEFPLDAVVTEFRQVCGGYPGLVGMFLQIQIAAARADGVMHPADQAVFNRICALLGIPPIVLRQYEDFARARPHFGGGEAPARERTDRLAAAYQTLGIASAASDEEVKRAYRRLMKENHPDRLVAKGLPPEMMALAQEKAKQINLAYEAIKAARGMK